jgi:hypothetical protein
VNINKILIKQRFEWYDPVGYVSYVEHGRGSSGFIMNGLIALIFTEDHQQMLGVWYIPIWRLMLLEQMLKESPLL